MIAFYMTVTSMWLLYMFRVWWVGGAGMIATGPMIWIWRHLP